MEKQKTLIEYALKDERLIHVSEVERRLKCGCICPVCKGVMIAHQGEQKADHFAHHGDECLMGTKPHCILWQKSYWNKIKGFYCPLVPTETIQKGSNNRELRDI